MGATREVRIFKRLDAHRDEPFATSRRDMMRRLSDPGHEDEVVVFEKAPPVRGPGSAGLGDLAPSVASQPVVTRR